MNYMMTNALHKIHIGICMAVVCMAVSIGAVQAADGVPAKGGNITAIVVGGNPNAVQTGEAKDLQRIIKAITGRDIQVVSSAAKGRCIYIGCTPSSENIDSKLAKLGEEGMYLSVNGKRIICAGKDPRGTYYAVQELLYQMGCRWLWPGQYGECLPSGKSLDIPGKMEIAHTPDFEMRGGHCIQVTALPGEQPKHVDVEPYVDWAARNKWNRFKASYSKTWGYGDERGGEWRETSGHTTTTDLMPAELFSQHPEWFALVNGKRTATHPIGTTAMPCIGNPLVVQRFTNIVLDYFAANPTAKRYFIGANDEPSYWCECDDCKKLDPVTVDWSKNGEEELPMTDRWLYLVNKVAEAVDQKYPGKWIGTFAYGSTRSLPVKNYPRKNVMIEWTMFEHCAKHEITDSSCPVNKAGLGELKKWMDIAQTVSLYDYLDFYEMEVPQAYWMSDQDYYRDLYKMGIRHISDEIDTSIEAAPITMGYRARLLWDINTDAKSYMSDLCDIAYGPAAGDMKRFWQLQQDAVYRSETKHIRQNDLARFTPQMISESYKILDSADKKKLTSDQRARIARARLSVLFAEWYVAKEASGNGDLKSLVKMTANKAAIYKLCRQYGFAMNLAAYQPLGPEESSSVINAISGKQLVKLPEKWQFRTDPDKQGLAQRWFDAKTDTSAFKPLAINQLWDKQWVGQYIGDAWYVCDVTIPETTAKHVWLLFGAIDDSWTAWLNGQQIGYSVGAPGDIWDKPQAIDITGKYQPGQDARIAVKVGNVGGAGGIWRSAMITVTD